MTSFTEQGGLKAMIRRARKQLDLYDREIEDVESGWVETATARRRLRRLYTDRRGLLRDLVTAEGDLKHTEDAQQALKDAQGFLDREQARLSSGIRFLSGPSATEHRGKQVRRRREAIGILERIASLIGARPKPVTPEYSRRCGERRKGAATRRDKYENSGGRRVNSRSRRWLINQRKS